MQRKRVLRGLVIHHHQQVDVAARPSLATCMPAGQDDPALLKRIAFGGRAEGVSQATLRQYLSSWW